jgi:hypothetical protein
MAALLTPELRAVEQPPKLEPANEIDRDPALRSYVDQLSLMVARKSASDLLAEMDPRFRVEFSRGKGPEAFRKYWKPDSPEAGVWKVLARLFAIGGTFYSSSLFAIPYVYTRFPINLDPFEYVAALKDEVQVRSEASSEVPVIATISRNLVRVSPKLKPPVRLDSNSWIRVVTPTGATGFVNSSDVYSPAAHRVFFEKRRGRWRWISLVCAD